MKHKSAIQCATAIGLGFGARLASAQSEAAPAGSGNGAVLTAIVLVAVLLGAVGAAVKVFDLKRKREAEAVHLQAQVSEALMREPGLFGLPVTATARVPLWSGTPATLELSGQVPTAEAHDAVLKIVREEASRIRPDFALEDRTAVVPAMAGRAA